VPVLNEIAHMEVEPGERSTEAAGKFWSPSKQGGTKPFARFREVVLKRTLAMKNVSSQEVDHVVLIVRSRGGVD
jgi:hypothetical protein